MTAVEVEQLTVRYGDLAAVDGVDLTVGWRCHLDQASVCRIVAGPRGPVLVGFNETRR